MILAACASNAYELSQADTVNADMFIPGMFYGRGMWPSFQTASYVYFTDVIYGSQSPENISLQSLYGSAFQYADKVLNAGFYTESDTPINKYFEASSKGTPILNFTLYVPPGYGKLKGIKIPNVEESKDPGKIFTVHFTQVW